jgi:hypothetical protein
VKLTCDCGCGRRFVFRTADGQQFHSPRLSKGFLRSVSMATKRCCRECGTSRWRLGRSFRRIRFCSKACLDAYKRRYEDSGDREELFLTSLLAQSRPSESVSGFVPSLRISRP